MTITTLPIAPSRQRPTDFSNEADAFLGALPTFGTEVNQVASEINLAASQIIPALPEVLTARTEAVQARDEAVLLVEAYQGALNSDPLLDKNSNPLTAGDWYTNSVTGYIRAYNGTSWVNGVTAVAGVNSINGQTGDVTLQPSAIGDVIYTANTPIAPEWLPCDGSIYLQSSYPELFSKLGTETNPVCQEVSTTFTPTIVANYCKFDPTDTYLAVASDSAPYIYIAKRDNYSFTKLADPATLPPGPVYDLSWDSTGTYLAVVHEASPFISIYKRTSDTFTKLANPSTLPTGVGNGCSFDGSGTYLCVTHNISPYISIYKRTSDTFTKLANPVSLPGANQFTCDWNPDSSLLCVGGQGTDRVSVYSRTGDTFTKLAAPDVIPGVVARVKFSKNNKYLAVLHGEVSNVLYIYSNSNGLLVKTSSPNIPAVNAPTYKSSIDWDTSSRFLVATIGIGIVFEEQGGVFSARDYKYPSGLPTGGNFSNNGEMFITGKISTLKLYSNFNYDKTTQFKLPTTYSLQTGSVKAYIKAI